MAFADVVFLFKQIVPASKLTQLRDNIVAHDHRADGSQGVPLQSIPWTDVTALLVEEPGWDISLAKCRSLLGGNVLQWDFTVVRSGATLTGNADTGSLANSPILNGIPAEFRPPNVRLVPANVGSDYPGWITISAAGEMTLTSLMPDREITNGQSITIRAVGWAS
jgi:hypothetical protein